MPHEIRRRPRARFRGTGLRKSTRDGGHYGWPGRSQSPWSGRMSTIGYRFEWLKTKRADAIAKMADSSESHALDRRYVTLHQPLIFLRRL
jgi:hypothetical protein